MKGDKLIGDAMDPLAVADRLLVCGGKRGLVGHDRSVRDDLFLRADDNEAWKARGGT